MGGCVNGAAAGWPRKEIGLAKISNSLLSVNGAAAGWPRKAAPSSQPAPRWTGVNGAAAGWPRKALAWRVSLLEVLRVNGAAAGWPRKDVGHADAATCRTVASMGPRPDGRGRWRPSGVETRLW